jgi:hypothetical protein
MAVGFNMIPIDWEILNLIDSNYVVGLGVLLIVFGVFVSLKGDKRGKAPKGGEDEIPIFEGIGKSRRIVGYRKG